MISLDLFIAKTVLLTSNHLALSEMDPTEAII